MRLDIIVPAHNEEHRIDRMLGAFRSRLHSPAVRFLVALDHCTDRTQEVVEQHARADGRVRVVSYPKLGKGGVILETLRHCDGDVVGFVDADCATPPMEFLRLAEAVADPMTGTDVAIATRWHCSAVTPGRRSLTRRVESRVFAGTVRALFGLPYRDTQCGAKAFRADVARAVVPFVSSRDFLFDVEFLVAARSLGFSVREIPTVWVDRVGSRLRAGRDGCRMAVSALRLWLHMRILPIPSAGEARSAPPLSPLPAGQGLGSAGQTPGPAGRRFVPAEQPPIDLTEPLPAGSSR